MIDPGDLRIFADSFMNAGSWLLPFLLMLPGLSLLQRRLSARQRGREGEAQVGRALERLFPAVAHDLILPNGRGDLTQIDHVALTPKGFLVVETKHYRGMITGQTEDPHWIQRIGRRRHEFQNPRRQNYAHVKAIQALGLGVPILEHVVFTNTAHFPDGLPAGVSRLATIAQDLEACRRGRISAALRTAWGQLLSQARRDHASRRAHRRGLRQRYGRDPQVVKALVWFGLAGTAALALWLFHQPFSFDVEPMHGRLPAAASVTTPASRLPLLTTSAVMSSPSPRTQPSRDLEIAWADPAAPSHESEDCRLAIAAVLIANTAESRWRRGKACARTTDQP
ncbi:nuclease-related domain-containing protein [Thiobaca trueperi]|uniref:Nuclease-like protein n=1 Tax=Thiobaca trueperi TaxID=127458 RepID=A0A4R3N6T2_9GAMM|nr:nuclease-related domain-containing protein [Thiobaca trueperi]TCT22813.1 nuclease-like protein [Thiobaca trueperi]